MSYDPRKQFVLSVVATICGGPPSAAEEISKKLHDDDALNAFLDDPR